MRSTCGCFFDVIIDHGASEVGENTEEGGELMRFASNQFLYKNKIMFRNILKVMVRKIKYARAD